VETVSSKAAFAARTIRPGIHRHARKFLVGLEPRELKYRTEFKLYGIHLSDVTATLDQLKIDRSISAVQPFFSGGTSTAKQRFQNFIESGLSKLPEEL
jgi:deoxyribodipyrimidine photo-lyase